MLPLETDEVLSLRNPRCQHATGDLCCAAVGLAYGCIGVRTSDHLSLNMPWIPCTACYNNILRSGCRLTHSGYAGRRHGGEVAGLPRVRPMALGYGLPPDNNNDQSKIFGDLNVLFGRVSLY